MCGITGYFDPNGLFIDSSQSIIQSMSESIEHRGPDYRGIWISEDKRLLFGHQRLSILDLSVEGNQPMISSSGRFVIIFNGEIYNHLTIKDSFSNKSWRGTSDTEILLEAMEKWGIEKSVKKIEGMFAFVVLDKKNNKLTLVRDRLGEKPLYYGWSNDSLIFGSELKSLRRHPGFDPQLNFESAGLYFRYGYIPGEETIYSAIKKVVPGQMVSFNLKSADYKQSEKSIYWHLSDSLVNPRNNSDNRTLSDCTEELEKILIDVISDESISDVPLGSFLSGGIDSSLVSALLQKINKTPIETFSIGYEEEKYNEANFARSVAQHLNTKHNELILKPRDLINVIPTLPQLFDEPFADPSAVPTLLVSKFAKTKLTVCLSGDGGDELFGGYPRYFRTNKIWEKTEKIPSILRKSISPLLKSINNVFSDRDDFGKFQKIHLYLKSDSVIDTYKLQSQLSNYELDKFLNIESNELNIFTPSKLSGSEKMMFLDSMTYLPDDILTKVDRSAMNVSLETRAPFLHHRVVEYAFNLPLEYKLCMSPYRGKIILQNLLSKYLPLEKFNRPKMGFGIPIDDWLRNDLKEWAGDNLSKDQLERLGIFKPEIIRKRFDEHLKGDKQWHYFLWKVLMFVEWQKNNSISIK